MIYYRNGVSFAGEYRGKLVVEGICLIVARAKRTAGYLRVSNVIRIVTRTSPLTTEAHGR